MVRGHEEASTNQVRRKRGTPWETPTLSILVAAKFVKDLRSFKQVLVAIRLDVSYDMATLTIGALDNVVYFTRERFAVGLCLLISSLVKQFLHFTRAPPALIYSNVFGILMGSNVLNSLYQLYILLVEICFIYTLKLGIGGRLSMSTRNPQLQFLTGLLDYPKT